MPRINGDAANAAALGQTARGLLAPEIALGRAVTKQRSHAELLTRRGEDGERSLDQMRRFMMIDERGGAGKKRARDIVHGGHAQRLGVESAVEPPPHPLEDLRESFRRRRGPRHAVARKPAVEMGVRANRAGGNLAIATGEHARRRRAATPRLSRPITATRRP